MELPTNLQRMARFCSKDFREMCQLSLFSGRPTIVQAGSFLDAVGPDEFVVYVEYKRLGPGQLQKVNGQDQLFMTVLLNEPAIHESMWTVHRDLAEALEKIEQEKARLIAEGWGEFSIDPTGDPD